MTWQTGRPPLDMWIVYEDIQEPLLMDEGEGASSMARWSRGVRWKRIPRERLAWECLPNGGSRGPFVISVEEAERRRAACKTEREWKMRHWLSLYGEAP